MRIDKYIYNELSKERDVSRSLVTQVLRNLGDVQVNRGSDIKYKKASYKLKEGETVQYSTAILLEAIDNEIQDKRVQEDIMAIEGELDIIYEDSDILVINKTAGVVIHPGVGRGTDTLANFVRFYLESKDEFDIQMDRAGVVHRLDKGVSGLVVFAKNKKAQDHLKSLFENHKVDKYYLASVQTKVRKSKLPDSLEGYISRDVNNRKRMEFTKEALGTNPKKSKQLMKKVVLDEKENLVLVKILTGRTHQIRASLKSLGLVIEGDELYQKNNGKNPDEIGLKSIGLGFKGVSGDYMFWGMVEELGQEKLEEIFKK